jgi:hypothetical protein
VRTWNRIEDVRFQILTATDVSEVLNASMIKEIFASLCIITSQQTVSFLKLRALIPADKNEYKLHVMP